MDDIEQIKNLKARYFRTLDTKDWKGFRGVFTPDFVSDTTGSGGKVIEGADEFVDFVSTSLASNITVHQGHMPEIEISSADSASGIWALEDLIRFPFFIDMRGYGHYHEEYRKIDGQWLISYSRLSRLRMDFGFLFLIFKFPEFLMKKLRAGKP